MSRLRRLDALLVAFAVLAAAIGWHWLDFARVAHQVGQSEPPTLNIHWWWVHGFAYTRLEAFPRVFSPYGPVFHGLLRLLPDVPGHPYLMGRAVSLFATAGIFALVAVWVRRRGGDGRAAALAVLLLWSTRPVFIFAPLYRVDMLGVSLALGGYVAATQAERGWARWAGVLLLGLAFHTKMSLLAAPLAMTVFWWLRDRRRAVGYGAAWLLLAVLGVLALNHWTGGGFLANAYRAPAKWGRGFEVLMRPLFASPLWVVALLALRRRGAPGELRAEWCYLGAVGLVTFVTGANWGASWNYLIELYIALAVVTGMMAGRVMGQPAPTFAPPPCQGGGIRRRRPAPAPRLARPLRRLLRLRRDRRGTRHPGRVRVDLPACPPGAGALRARRSRGGARGLLRRNGRPAHAGPRQPARSADAGLRGAAGQHRRGTE
ncbi:MAG: hypothetical protein HYU66_25470 [Armatimonadetes bacterium]|nr:hypothetical protein [Armatimonadota bacterium]